MTTILQSCLETQCTETRTLMLKVASSPTTLGLISSTMNSCNYPTSTSEMNNNDKALNHDSRGWSFLHVFSNVSSSSNPKGKMEEKENVYVHPLTKQYSSSRLSEKSLELCTENLGSETGSEDIMSDISILSLSSLNSPTNSEISWPKEQEKQPQEVGSMASSTPKHKVNNNNASRKFPPPLTTISGSNSLQFRPHREDGRLVIQAVEAPSKHTYFQAERGSGRLRLSFLRDHASMFDSQLTGAEENDAAVVLHGDSEEEGSYEGEGVDCDHDFLDHHCCYEQLEEDDEEYAGEEEEMMTSYMGRDVDGNISDVEVDMGREKSQRLMNSRCNEGGHGNKGLICNWPEALWVATS